MAEGAFFSALRRVLREKILIKENKQTNKHKRAVRDGLTRVVAGGKAARPSPQPGRGGPGRPRSQAEKSR